VDILNKILNLRPVLFLIGISKKIVLPGFDGVPLYNVAVFFVKGLYEGYITTRAAAVSFSFFLAIFPSLIFLFTIIPFIPIQNFQQSLLMLIQDFIPGPTYLSVKETIEDIVTHPRGGLLSLGFVLALYFATSGIHNLIDAFNSTYHAIETRSVIRQRLISVFLVVILSFLLIISIGLMTFGTHLLGWIFPAEILKSIIYIFVIWLIKWLIILVTLFFAISFIYYFAPAKKENFRFISAGSTLATLLVVITTQGFNFYVSNFSKYNALYGSIGTLLIILLWIYFNAISLLIGFELNVSIVNARKKQ
jgi:membrane protein